MDSPVFWFGLVLKIAMTASITVAASVVVERSGPFIGSLIAALPTAGGAALIILGDEPLLRDDAIEHLVYYWRQKGISIRPRYSQQPDAPGHPVLLDRGLWHLVDRLEGDHGLSSLLASQPGAVATLDLPGANPDVDTREDLRELEGDA